MKTQIIAPAQSLEAREILSLNQPAVVTGVKAKNPAITFNKPYFSEWESGKRNLSAAVLRCIRDFYESEGYEFIDEPAANDDQINQPGDHVRVVRDAMLVCDRLSHSERGAIQDRINNLVEKVQSEGKAKAAEGLFDTYDEETDLKRDKAIAVLAEIGLLYSLLFRQCPLERPSKAILKRPASAKTISEVLSVRFAKAFDLIAEPPTQDPSLPSNTNTGKPSVGGV